MSKSIPAPTPIWKELEQLMPADKRVIGVDEAGKGDFFGPLVVAGVLCKESEEKKLRELGVRDSKLIADKKLLTIDELIRNAFAHCVLVISPEEYNSKYRQIRNLNKLLAECHAVVISELSLKHGADKAIIDKFGKAELVESALNKKNIDIQLVQDVGGERHAPVAAASILARAAFVREMDSLSRKAGMEIPKGASALVDRAGQKLVKKYGEHALLKMAKLHFKNYDRVVSPTLFG